MNADRCQRWGGGREAWRPAGELVDVSRFEVEPIAEDVAKAFVTRSAGVGCADGGAA